MSAPTLFDFIKSVAATPGIHSQTGRVRATDGDTSREAARSVGKGVEEAALVEHWRAHNAGLDGLTDEQLCDRLHWWLGATVISGRSRLKKRGLLIDSGQRRENRRGSNVILWRLVDG